MSDGMAIRVVRCARCGGTHDAVEFRPLTHASSEWSHWGTCPTNGEPIMMSIHADGEEVAYLRANIGEIDHMLQSIPEGSSSRVSLLDKRDDFIEELRVLGGVDDE